MKETLSQLSQLSQLPETPEGRLAELEKTYMDSVGGFFDRQAEEKSTSGAERGMEVTQLKIDDIKAMQDLRDFINIVSANKERIIDLFENNPQQLSNRDMVYLKADLGALKQKYGKYVEKYGIPSEVTKGVNTFQKEMLSARKDVGMYDDYDYFLVGKNPEKTQEVLSDKVSKYNKSMRDLYNSNQPPSPSLDGLHVELMREISEKESPYRGDIADLRIQPLGRPLPPPTLDEGKKKLI